MQQLSKKIDSYMADIDLVNMMCQALKSNSHYTVKVVTWSDAYCIHWANKINECENWDDLEFQYDFKSKKFRFGKKRSFTSRN